MSRARASARLAAHALALATVALCVILPRSRYDWVDEVAPGIDPAGFEGGSDATVALAAIAVIAIALELLAVFTARAPRERGVAATLLAATVVCGAWRLLG